MLGRLGKDAGSLLGLEIAPDSIRMLQLQRRRGHCQVSAWALEPLDGGPLRDAWASDPAPVVAALRRAHQRTGSKQRRVAIALPGSQVISKVRRLSAGLNDVQMEAQVLAEADQFIPFPLDDTALDFQVLGPSLDQPGWVDVAVAACRQSHLDPLEQILAQAGLQARLVDVDSLALQRVLPSAPQTRAVVQLEMGRVVLHAWHAGPIPMRQELHAVPITPESIEQWLRCVLQGARVDVLLLAGAGGACASLRGFLQDRLGIPTRRLEPLTGLDLTALPDADDLTLARGAMATACGLAMGGLR
ncbi:hypothetical protein PS627_00996 [Pseudomonas fluorescens]|uniref:type IV pilus biogenesis protein PilM n=1 Tax=Pseudomonas fluorescens TaxID=294 RepID=UPI0012563C54|nr:pilus assembly protein PilM [Pseudomonas fluorescens]CAG8864370.1 hypothetical protein PS627_00996 [Pseudomonas fluorescens]VVP73134.1 hypothetical protein PS910_01205 [Pseudomonas fluorescens]